MSGNIRLPEGCLWKNNNTRDVCPAIKERCQKCGWRGHYEINHHNYSRGEHMKPIAQKKPNERGKNNRKITLTGKTQTTKCKKQNENIPPGSSQEREDPQQGLTANTKAEPTTTGEPNQNSTLIDPKSGATVTELCEFRPTTTRFLRVNIQRHGAQKPANTVYGRRLLRSWTTQTMDQ